MLYYGDALEYISETPGILQYILENEKEILKESRKLLKGKEISEIYFAGSGSSYNAAAAVSSFGKKRLGIQVFPVYPSALVEDCGMISENAVIVGISQQGTSSAVIQALDAARSCGITVISMTGEYHTEITRHSEANIYIECGYEDAGATTKGYTATILTLVLFLLMAGECMGKLSEQEIPEDKVRLQKVINNMESVLKDCRPWCGVTAQQLKDSKELMLIAGNGMRSLLLEGCLKFSETCRFPVRGYEAEEFMHGIYNAVTDCTDFLYLFPPEGNERQRMERLYEYYRRKGACQYGRDLSCRYIDDPDFSVLEYILPLQVLFVLASRARGIDLNIPKDPDFHKYMGSKLEEPVGKGEK